MERIPEEKLLVVNDRFFKIKRYMPLTLHDLEKPFVYHSSYYRTCVNKNAVNVITLHDFTYEYFGNGLSKIIHSKTKRKALQKADYVVCVSESTRKDFMSFMPEKSPAQICVIHNGASDSYRQTTNTYEDYLLFVGARSRYKNFNLAVECASYAGMPLVICGSSLTKKEKDFLEKVLPGKYFEKGFVTEDELNDLYNNAFALLYPSSYEGFGIPVVEAQKAGCPVVALNNSSLPEVIGNVDMLCDSADVKELLDKINLLKDPTIRQEIITDGLRRSSSFSWDKMFEEYRMLYNKIENNTK